MAGSLRADALSIQGPERRRESQPCSRHGLSSSLMARITSNGNTGRPTAAVAYNLGLWLDQEHLDALPLAGATVSSTVSDETGARR